MSSPSVAAAKAVTKPAHTKPVGAQRRAPAGSAGDRDEIISGRAMLLAREIERKVARGAADGLTIEALQALIAALSKAYATRVEAGSFAPSTSPCSSSACGRAGPVGNSNRAT